MCIVTGAIAAGMLGAGAAAGTAEAGILTGVSVMQGLAIDASLAGLGLSAMGTYQQTEASNAQARYQSQVAANNAQIAENEANYARTTAEKNAQAQERKTMQVIGAQRAAEGASGAVVDNGSFMDVSLDTVDRGTYDALALLNEGDRAAWRAENQAGNYMAQSQLYDSSQKSALLPVGGSLLAGAGQIGSNWYYMSNGKRG